MDKSFFFCILREGFLRNINNYKLRLLKVIRQSQETLLCFMAQPALKYFLITISSGFYINIRLNIGFYLIK
jgi:hypothetical protein